MKPKTLLRGALFALPFLLGAAAALFWVGAAGRGELARNLERAGLRLGDRGQRTLSPPANPDVS